MAYNFAIQNNHFFGIMKNESDNSVPIPPTVTAIKQPALICYTNVLNVLTVRSAL